jgi:hypothetical protein
VRVSGQLAQMAIRTTNASCHLLHDAACYVLTLTDINMQGLEETSNSKQSFNVEYRAIDSGISWDACPGQRNGNGMRRL